MRIDEAALDAARRTRRRAREMAGDQPLHGPLAGYHHETYAFPHREAPGAGRWKLREPRRNVIWCDRRAFDEEELLIALAGRVSGVPDVIRVGSATLHRYIEGQTLGSRFRTGTEIPDAVVAQLMGLVRNLASVRPDSVPVRWRVPLEDREQDGDSHGFLERLVHFAEEQVYARNEHRFGTLFRDIGVDRDAFKRLRRHLGGLTERPFHLLHGDLHRENLILDPVGRLWAIDWELAVFGDPLYDLATHLHLMRYPQYQAHRVVELWTASIEDAAMGASRHWQEDLPRILAFKHAQSVFTDVIRAALDLANDASLRATVPRLRKVLRNGAVPLGLTSVPTPCETAVALTRWRRSYASQP
ncbi:phosphotransferase [Streptomyces blattellae]|uniref:phosphotransferase n=1 Tax=Streptomyces blattellae TaxID=2569855 RepID=UPI001E64B75A|nr:phosphotransferase [Streptomyces blattellae]